MGKLKTNRKLQGDYGEIIFEHFSEQNNYAYISLEDIYNTLTPNNKLSFKFGYERIEVTLPEEIVNEVRGVCQPTNRRDADPSFVYDYFTVTLRTCFEWDSQRNVHRQIKPTNPACFNWVEVKTGKSGLSKNQKEFAKRCSLPISIFRIPVEIPKEIDIEWGPIDPKYRKI